MHTTFSALLGTLCAEKHQAARQFELLCKWYLENAPEYRGLVRQVWLWNHWPGRWGSDAGIDLVVEAHDGGLWAVQAKHYDEHYYIKKRDIDSFLTESSRPQFTYRLVIATTHHLGPTARKTIAGQAVPVGLCLRDHLNRSEAGWPAHIDALRPARPEPKELRDHQTEALTAIVEGLAAHDRAQALMACGTGKTLVGLAVAEQLDVERSLVLIPSLSLLGQTMREWTTNFRRNRAVLAVCSDQTVSGEDDFVERTSDLGVPVTTDPAAIAAFLESPGPRVVFATYQSSPQVAEACRRTGASFGLAIADEAHRCAGPAAGPFATILAPGAIRADKRLFMTATPRYFTRRVVKAAADADFEIVSMDDEERFGPVVYRLPFSEAIARGLLADYQVLILGVDDLECRELVDHAALVQTPDGRTRDARTVAAQLAVAKSMRKLNLRRVLSFHNRVDAARRFGGSFCSTLRWMPPSQAPSGPTLVDHVSGTMASGDRALVLDRLAVLDGYDQGLLTNARCLGEGVDVPAIDGVAFVDPRRSAIDIVQAVGRAIRRAEEKTHGTVIVPVLVPSGVDADTVLDDSAFRHVWDVLRALRAHDDLLSDQLDELRRQLGRRGGGKLKPPAKILIDLPGRLPPGFVDAFTVRLVEQTTASWESWLGLLTRYAEREGTPLVPQDHVEDGERLGLWVTTQRRWFTKGWLAPDRVATLAALPGWSWNPQDDAWHEAYGVLGKFVAEHGHARPKVDAAHSGFRVGRWVDKQRVAHRTGRLSADRRSLLEGLPGWAWEPSDDDWSTAYDALVRWATEHHSCRVPTDVLVDGVALGRWAQKQRTADRSGRLAPERKALLDRVQGWTWAPQTDQWEAGFAALARFVEERGHARVPAAFVDSAGYRVGQWAQTQRNAKLSEAQRKRLAALPGWTWDPFDDAWSAGLAALRQYQAEHGHCLVPSKCRTNDGMKLGQWVNKQRNDYAASGMSTERAGLLEAVPGWAWNAREAVWEANFECVREFISTHGHCHLPRSHRCGDLNVGLWLNNQRHRYKTGELPTRFAERLEKILGWSP